MRRPYLRFAVPLVALLLVAGCGSSSKKTSGPSGATTAAPSTQSTTSTPAGAGTSAPSGAGVQQAVSACKSSIDRSPQLTASDKSDLKKICDKAATGDVNGARKATADVCARIAERTVPAGSARDQAVAACKTAAP